MIIEIATTFGFGIAIGLALGLTGGGGSLFAMPLLLFGLHLSPVEAVPISLVAVGITAITGAAHAIRARLVVWQPTVMFVIGGVIGAPAGIYLARFLTDRTIIVGFAMLATGIGVLMSARTFVGPRRPIAIRARPEYADAGPICVLAPDGQLRFTAPCALVLSLAGIVTGMLSGLFGVGGGFLIVPALMLVTRMGIHSAVATSLLIISAIGFAGAASAIIGGNVNWAILLPFSFGGAAAMLASRRLAPAVSGVLLQRVFSVFVLLVGVAMLAGSFL